MKFYSDLVPTEGKEKPDILVPMCGRAQTLLTLNEKGHRVVGIEWSKPAVERFFDENNLDYRVEPASVGGDDIPVYTSRDKNITIYCGDFFCFKDNNLGGFDCIFDHGAIGCFDFEEEKRTTYAKIIYVNSRTQEGEYFCQPLITSIRNIPPYLSLSLRKK